MDTSEINALWVALGISAIVGGVFVVVARHWQKLLTQQAWSIRRLTDRLHTLEEVADPNFQKKLEETTPSPLERVYTFGLRFDEDFWNRTVHATESQRRYVRQYGNFLGSVKIECRRRHVVVTVSEVLPEEKSASWQTRTFDIFPEDLARSREALTLWQMDLAGDVSGPTERAWSTVELRWKVDQLDLCWRYSETLAEAANGQILERVLFTVPLDAKQLGTYRTNEWDGELADESGGAGPAGAATPIDQPRPAVSFFGNHDAETGVEWNLAMRDLSSPDELKRWKVYEVLPITTAS
jgi:hypothetical protein